ncbi:MAG: NAD(P)-dependent oxidoreductase [Eubacteriales bacterium]
MMKIAIYSARDDEQEFFSHFGPAYGVELVMLPVDPVPETVQLAAGCDAVSIITSTHITSPMLDGYKALGIQYISTRTIGCEHIDVAYATSIGIGVGNVGYTPYSVAEYTIMMMLMALRHVKTLLNRSVGQDYSLHLCVRGRLIHEATVGIIGTGKIGGTVAKLLSGFGCKVLAYDLWENPDLADLVEYVPLDALLKRSDIVTLHAPSTAENFHLLNAKNLATMQTGAVLVNTARGNLVDTEALIEALERGHLGGAALDLVEGDRSIYYRDKKGVQLQHRSMAILNAMPNVVMMPHMAFYTDQSVSDMVENSIKSCIANVTA